MKADVAGRIAACALTVIVGLALTGCASSPTPGSGAGPAPVPEGFQRFTESGVSFAYPAGWRIGRPPGQAATSVVRITPPADPPDAAESLVGFAQFEVSSSVDPEESFGAHVSEETGVYGRDLVDQGDVDVPGAPAARRFELEYDSPEGGARMRKLDLVVVGPDRRTLYNFYARAPVGQAAELEPALESFRLGG